jgi:hypothetical protein
MPGTEAGFVLEDPPMAIRRVSIASLATLALLLSAGCGQQAAQNTTTGANSDSLLAASPIEPAQGQLQPQATVPQPTPEQVQSAPTPAPQQTTTPPPPQAKPKPKPQAPPAPSATVAAGTGVKITIGTALTSETATVGQEWIGQVAEAVTVGPMAPFPAGSVVHGVVSAVKPAEKGDRALLILRVTSIEANGRTHQISATADSLIAGSTRARNVGAVAGSAAAGALIGSAVGGSKGALIGGILGGAAATGAAAGSKGFQVTVKEGAEMVFKVDHDTKLKL